MALLGSSSAELATLTVSLPTALSSGMSSSLMLCSPETFLENCGSRLLRFACLAVVPFSLNSLCVSELIPKPLPYVPLSGHCGCHDFGGAQVPRSLRSACYDQSALAVRATCSNSP